MLQYTPLALAGELVLHQKEEKMIAVQHSNTLKFSIPAEVSDGTLAIDENGFVFTLKRIHDRPTRYAAIPKKNSDGCQMRSTQSEGMVMLLPYTRGA